MKHKIKQMIAAAVDSACQQGDLPAAGIPEIMVEAPKADIHGDFSTNAAMLLASSAKKAPRVIATAILAHMDDSEGILAKTDIAGPGFINFFIKPGAWLPVLKAVHAAGAVYGAGNIGRGRRIQIEFVSSNPTGPLHVGHGRGAAVGDSVGNILAFCGFDVQKEYYINDSGRQIHTLGLSVYLRCRTLMGETVAYPDECYQGDYIRDIAADIVRDQNSELQQRSEASAIEWCARLAAEQIIKGIREDLTAFGVTFDRWYSEQSLYDAGKVAAMIDRFTEKGVIYPREGALWFKTAAFGDEKDRVVVRRNGQTTYFASDIAYHQEKYERGFDKVIDVWGADHHGYIPRMKASVEALGYDRSRFDVILVQLVNLLRGGRPVAMSTRAGEFVTLDDVVREVGTDAARFIFLTRHYESPLDFDLDVAKQKTNDNPVYYVQYVHARISSIIRKGEQKGITRGANAAASAVRLTAPEEINLIKQLDRYPETVRLSAETMEPHRITFYLMNLASDFHSYYNKHRVLTDDPVLTQGRLYLVSAVRSVIRNGLRLLGVSAPETM